jgi:hypothetical protein
LPGLSVYASSLTGRLPRRYGCKGQLVSSHNLISAVLPHEQSRHFARIDAIGVSTFFSSKLPTLLGGFSDMSVFSARTSSIITALRFLRY